MYWQSPLEKGFYFEFQVTLAEHLEQRDIEGFGAG